jgi:hypothetical protein
VCFADQQSTSSWRPISCQRRTFVRNFVPTSYPLRANTVYISVTSYQLRTSRRCPDDTNGLHFLCLHSPSRISIPIRQRREGTRFLCEQVVVASSEANACPIKRPTCLSLRFVDSPGRDMKNEHACSTTLLINNFDFGGAGLKRAALSLQAS